MTVQRQLRLARWAIFVASAIVVLALAKMGPLQLAFVGAFVVLGAAQVLTRRANRFIARRAFTRLHTRVRNAEFADAHTLLAELAALYRHSKSGTELVRSQEAQTLVLEGRFHEAVRLYESLDRRHIQPRSLPWLLNNFAWSLAQTGDGPRAVATAREAIEANAADDRVVDANQLRACQLGTLGASLVVAGEPDQAIDYLEQALARGGSPQHQAIRAFYLGEALHALGRPDDARSAWRRAVESDADDDFGRRARERLDSPAPPYRS